MITPSLDTTSTLLITTAVQLRLVSHSKLPHSIKIWSDKPTSKRTNPTQLQALLPSTKPSKILEIGTRILTRSRRTQQHSQRYKLGEECRHPGTSPELLSHSHRGTKWRRAPKTSTPPEYLYPLLKLGSSKPRRRLEDALGGCVSNVAPPLLFIRGSHRFAWRGSAAMPLGTDIRSQQEAAMSKGISQWHSGLVGRPWWSTDSPMPPTAPNFFYLLVLEAHISKQGARPCPKPVCSGIWAFFDPIQPKHML